MSYVLSSISNYLSLHLSKDSGCTFLFKSSTRSFVLSSATCLHAFFGIFRLQGKNVIASNVVFANFYTCMLHGICNVLKIALSNMIECHELTIGIVLMGFHVLYI